MQGHNPPRKKQHQKSHLGTDTKGVAILPTLQAHICNPRDHRRTSQERILIDGGAQVSFITKELVARLQIPIQHSELIFTTIGDQDSLGGGKVTIDIKSIHTNRKVRVTAHVLNVISGPFRSIKEHPLDKYPSLQAVGKPMADTWPQRGVSVSLLIGQDYYWGFMQGKLVWPTEADPERGPAFLDSAFGLIAHGFATQRPVGGQALAAVQRDAPLDVPKSSPITRAKEDPLEVLLKKLWDLESIGMAPPERVKLKATEVYAVDYLEKTMKFLPDCNRFQVKIPWDENKPPLQNNHAAAASRLRQLWQHLDKDATKKRLYHEAMAKYLDKDHARPIDKEDENNAGIFYLPHSGVVTDAATGKGKKLRIVFDCSARDRTGLSLNEKMVTGPVPAADLVRILTRWRKRQYAFNLDIKDCFLSIRVDPQDQNMFRFLWSHSADEEPTTYKFTSLIFGSKCSPWISSTCIWQILDTHKTQFPETVEETKRGIWVDDACLSSDSVEEARKRINELTFILSKASFGLAKMKASHEEILQGVEDEKRLFPKGEQAEGNVKTLGISWDLQKDHILIDRKLQKAFEHGKSYDTKRTLTRMIGSIYDPLQMVLPWTIGGRLLVHAIWKIHGQEAVEQGVAKISRKFWDQQLPEHIQERVNDWKQQYPRVREISLPRWLAEPGQIEQQEIYGFADASPQALGAVVYLRTTYSDRDPTSRFVAARGKVNPDLTLPKAELTAARILTTLVHTVKEHLDLGNDTKVYLFSDSMITLYWLGQDPAKWNVFVCNAVSYIQQYSDKESWHYIPTEENPADLLTRPQTLDSLMTATCIWWEGPPYVKAGQLPEQPRFYEPEEDAELECRRNYRDPTPVVMAAFEVKASRQLEYLHAEAMYQHPVEILDRNCSDLLRILRTLAWILLKFGEPSTREKMQGASWAHRTTCAMEQVLLHLQRKHFQDERLALIKGNDVAGSSRLKNLDPFLDRKGLLRIGGRIDEAAGRDYDFRHPVILPSSDKLLGKIITYLHEINAHAGSSWLHNYLRQRFWILQGDRAIRKYVRLCMSCQRQHGQKLSQKLAPLPANRINVQAKCFEHIAIDSCGPLYVLNDKGATVKRDILVISCMVSRAINLEVLPDKGLHGFCHALRRHGADYGLPRTVRLDNYPTHKAVEKEFKALYSPHASQLREIGPLYGVSFNWSQPYAPSTNGVVEAAVKGVKNALIKTLQRALIPAEELITICKEIKGMINARPLTTVRQGEAAQDVIALKPNHLLYGHQLNGLPFLEAQPRAAARGDQDIRARWRQRQILRTEFLQLYIDRYLADLAITPKWHKNKDTLTAGELVLILDPMRKRREWPIGQIEKTIKGKDGLIRTAVIRTSKGVTNRSIRSLVRLRSDPEEDEPPIEKEAETAETPDTKPKAYAPKAKSQAKTSHESAMDQPEREAEQDWLPERRGADPTGGQKPLASRWQSGDKSKSEADRNTKPLTKKVRGRQAR